MARKVNIMTVSSRHKFGPGSDTKKLMKKIAKAIEQIGQENFIWYQTEQRGLFSATFGGGANKAYIMYWSDK